VKREKEEQRKKGRVKTINFPDLAYSSVKLPSYFGVLKETPMSL
jgi:hypothetical protein